MNKTINVYLKIKIEESSDCPLFAKRSLRWQSAASEIRGLSGDGGLLNPFF